MMFSLPQRGGWLVHVPSDRQETEYRRPDIFRQISGQVYSTTSPSWNDVPFCQLIELLLNLELAVIPGNGQRPIPQTINQRHTKTVKTTSRILRSRWSAPEWANFLFFFYRTWTSWMLGGRYENCRLNFIVQWPHPICQPHRRFDDSGIRSDIKVYSCHVTSSVNLFPLKWFKVVNVQV